MTTHATFTRHNDEWALRIESTTVQPGDSVTVSKRNGSQSVKTVGQIISRHQDITIAAIRVDYSGRICRSRGCNNDADMDVGSNRAMNGYCGVCAFDIYDM